MSKIQIEIETKDKKKEGTEPMTTKQKISNTIKKGLTKVGDFVMDHPLLTIIGCDIIGSGIIGIQNKKLGKEIEEDEDLQNRAYYDKANQKWIFTNRELTDVERKELNIRLRQGESARRILDDMDLR